MTGSEQGDGGCLYEMSQCYLSGYSVHRDVVKGFEFLKRAANVGYVGGKRLVGYCLHAGMGTDVDLVQSAKYYKVAAEAGDVHTLCHFALSIIFGHGVERNPKFGVGLLRTAAIVGSIDALVRLGDCYKEGWGVEEDAEMEFRLYSEAANRNNTYDCVFWKD